MYKVMYYHNLCKCYSYNEITNLLLEKLFTDACSILQTHTDNGVYSKHQLHCSAVNTYIHNTCIILWTLRVKIVIFL